MGKKVLKRKEIILKNKVRFFHEINESHYSEKFR